MRLRQLHHAGIGPAQAFMATGRSSAPLQQAAGQQFDLQHVLTRPAAGTVDIAQALMVPPGQSDDHGGWRGGGHDGPT